MRIPAFLLLGALLSAVPAVATDAASLLEEAGREAAAGRKDFAFLKLRALTHRYPADAAAVAARVAIGEYHLGNGDLGAAETAFTEAAGSADLAGLIAGAYLVECARRAGDAVAHERRAAALENALAERSFVGLFDGARSARFVSAFGNRFDLRETADRMEIRRNGETFHTIRLD